jgi:hypothetical protein
MLKKGNKKISGFRILIEYAIGGIKKCRNGQRAFQMSQVWF